MKVTKIKEGKINIFLHEEELEDLWSALDLAIGVANAHHRESPKFRNALHKMQRIISKAVRGIK